MKRIADISRKSVSLFLTLLMLFSLVPVAAAEEKEVFPETHFADMVYTEPDIPALCDGISALAQNLDGDSAEVLAEYDRLCDLYNDADSQLSYCYLMYALDITRDTWWDTYSALYDDLVGADQDITKLSAEILQYPGLGEIARKEWGDPYSDLMLREAELADERILPDLSLEQELTSRYDKLLQGFAYEYEGREITLEDIADMFYNGELGYEEYEKLFNSYSTSLNEQAGAIFLDLLEVRTRIAETLGFENYADYCYMEYDRDYTVEEADALAAAVKKYIVPVYAGLAMKYSEIYTMNPVTETEDAYFEALQGVVADFDPRIAEDLAYMLRNGLYEFTDSPIKMAGSFTTYLYNYRAPFISARYDGSIEGVRAGMHELGHFSRYRINAEEDISLDLNEVDSQGLQLLLSAYDNVFFGRNVNTATASLLSDALYAIIAGCMEDEFQRLIYADPDITLEEINSLYKRLANEYGFGFLYGYTGTEWVQISHTFQSPFYYISYAVSMIASMELWEKSQDDFDGAREDYFSILERPGFACFRDTVTNAGLADPLSPETVQEIAKAVKERLF